VSSEKRPVSPVCVNDLQLPKSKPPPTKAKKEVVARKRRRQSSPVAAAVKKEADSAETPYRRCAVAFTEKMAIGFAKMMAPAARAAGSSTPTAAKRGRGRPPSMKKDLIILNTKVVKITKKP
jgi:hypothetical protein